MATSGMARELNVVEVNVAGNVSVEVAASLKKSMSYSINIIIVVIIYIFFQSVLLCGCLNMMSQSFTPKMFDN